MQLSVANIFDLVLLVLLFIVALIYTGRGFLAGLLHLVGSVASIIGSSIAAQKGAAWVFENVLYKTYLKKMETSIAESGTVDVNSLLNEYGGFLPESIKNSAAETARTLLETRAPDLAQKLVEDVLRPLTMPMLNMVLFFVCFALCRLLLGLLVNLLTHANKVPVLGDMNRALGFCLGVLAGALDVFLVLCFVYVVIAITGDMLPYINSVQLQESFALKIFGYLNPFV